MDIIEGGIAAIAATFSGWAAYSAMQAARSSDRNSRSSNRTAELAYQTAESIAQIERDRWHRELTPTVGFRLTAERGWMELLVRYGGPAAVGRLEHLELTIRDDRDRSGDQLLAGGLTAEERAATIWGPYRFRASADGVDELGRTVAPLTLLRGEVFRLALDTTQPHRHYGGGSTAWEGDYREKDLRLWVNCHIDGHKPWHLTADIPRPHDGSTLNRWTRAH